MGRSLTKKWFTGKRVGMQTHSNQGLVIQIIATAHRLERLAERHFFAHFKLSGPNGKILMILGKRAPLTPSQLVECVGGTKSNVTQRLNVLERQGLVKRSSPKGQKDKRLVTVDLTPLGVKTTNSMCRSVKSKVLDLEKQLDTKLLAQATEALTTIHSILDAYEASSS